MSGGPYLESLSRGRQQTWGLFQEIPRYRIERMKVTLHCYKTLHQVDKMKLVLFPPTKDFNCSWFWGICGEIQKSKWHQTDVKRIVPIASWPLCVSACSFLGRLDLSVRPREQSATGRLQRWSTALPLASWIWSVRSSSVVQHPQSLWPGLWKEGFGINVVQHYIYIHLGTHTHSIIGLDSIYCHCSPGTHAMKCILCI